MNREAQNIDCDLLFLPNIWGGDDPNIGLDCSGFIGYVLRRLGVLPPDYDNTAQGYYTKFKGNTVEEPYAGCVAFYGAHPTRITHCMLIVSPRVCIGAVRGNKWTDTPEKAAARNARIDVRAIGYRKDLITIIDPFKEV